MPYPYTPNPLAAFMAAQVSLAVVLTALLWYRPLRPWPASVLLLAAVWVGAILPVEPHLLAGVGTKLAPDHAQRVMRAATIFAVAACVVARPRWIALVAMVGGWELERLSAWVTGATWELAALHIAWFALLLGLHVRRSYPTRVAPVPLVTRAHRTTDLALFAGAAVLAAIVSQLVLFRRPGSGDEWANMYQADLFAHLRAYGTPPPCAALFQSFWVFFYEGRSFCQYTPGWPLVLAPFQGLGVPWLANPVVVGATAVGVARVARRAVAAGIGGVARVTAPHVRAAGVIAAATATLGASMLLNGGSEYAHPIVAAGFAWSVESVAAMSDPKTEIRAKWRYGLLLGAATSLVAASRPAEGAGLGVGVFLFFVYALARRRFGVRPLLATTATFGLVGGLTLVVLRLQLGKWFQTAYSITGLYHPWAVMRLSHPLPWEVKHVLPLGTGAYMWWPAAPALGVAGLVTVRGRGRGIAFMLAAGSLCMLGFFYENGFLHRAATGYGPRFHLPLVVPMAIGTAALLAPLWVDARRRVGERRGLRTLVPATVALLAFVAGIVRLAPLVYPAARAEMRKKTAPIRAIEAAHLHHAVVSITRHEVYADPLDLVQDYATVRDPDVLIVHEWKGPEITCGKERWADRDWWHVTGIEEAELRRE